MRHELHMHTVLSAKSEQPNVFQFIRERSQAGRVELSRGPGQPACFDSKSSYLVRHERCMGVRDWYLSLH